MFLEGTFQKLQGEQKISATITHVIDQDKDQQAAGEIIEFLKNKDVIFHNGEGKMSFSVLEEARWNIFVLSERAVADPTMTAQYQAALECAISDNEVQVFTFTIWIRLSYFFL